MRSPRPRAVLQSVSIALVATVLGVGCTGSSAVSTGTSKTSATSQTSGQTSGTGTSGTSNGSSTLDWGTCKDDSVTETEVQCATLTVPIDYSASGGDTIDLALVRVPATARRTGAILFNPGGPGGSGFDYIAQGGTTISTQLGFSHFDLVGFDPRGVDRSNGIRCLTDAQQDQYAYLDDTPDSPQEQAALDAADVAFDNACTQQYGDTLRFYSTANTARDMDAIRVAMGDDEISYLGISYGTYLGAVYATMFPERVRALVLDSAFEPGGDTVEQQYETQLVGFEHAFDDWAAWCENNDSCAFRSPDVGAAWDNLLTQLDDHPVTNADGRTGNQVVMSSATIAALYSKTDWPVLGAALHDATTGDPSGLFRLADSYSGRDDTGHYDTIQQSNTVINCASGIESDTPPDADALVAHLKAVAPRFAKDLTAADLTGDSDCAKLMPAQPIDSISYSGDAPIVVVGGVNDPATPIRWATEMTAALGSSATMVTYTGEGHGQLLASKCVTAIEAALLTDLTSPDTGTVCAPDADIEEPTWWSSIPQPKGVDSATDSPEINAALGVTTTDLYSELRTSDLSAAEVLRAYAQLLPDAGFDHVTDQQPLPGTEQAVYRAPNGDVFSVFALDPAAFDDPQLSSAKSIVPAAKTVILLLFLPQ